MMKATKLKRRNTSIGGHHGHKVAGEERRCLIYAKSWDLSTKCDVGQALAANDVCWRNAA